MPLPVPFLVTVRVRWTRLKVAVTDLAAVIATMHWFDPLTESHPDQATAWVSAPGVPVRVTEVPWSY